MRFYEDAGPRGVRWIFRRLSSLANQKPGARSTGRADFTPWRRPDRPPISPAWPARASHRAAQRLIGGADPGSNLVLLEADTGSGKTEAALWRYALLYAAALVSGLYFSVPIRAAARQLHRRVNEAMKRLFGSDAPEAVLAIPGHLLSGEATGQRLPRLKPVGMTRTERSPPAGQRNMPPAIWQPRSQWEPSIRRCWLACIVIGSQTLEQSPDICADYLIADLRPVNVLLQQLEGGARRWANLPWL